MSDDITTLRAVRPRVDAPSAAVQAAACSPLDLTVPWRSVRSTDQAGHSGARLSRKAAMPSCASGVWLAAAMTSTAYV